VHETFQAETETRPWYVSRQTSRVTETTSLLIQTGNIKIVLVEYGRRLSKR